MSIVFINNTMETFTPTHSGAVATHIWECCRAAQSRDIEPIVVSQSAKASPYNSVKTILLDYPPIPQNRFLVKMLRAQRKLTGWRYLRQRSYAQKVVDTIRQNRLQYYPLILHNDPELAVFIRESFPRTFIVHHFHNPLETSRYFREGFGRSVNAVSGVSNFISRWAQTYYGLKNVRTIYNGVDSDRFSPAPQQTDGPPVINFVGRTGIEKAPDLLLRAARLLARKTRAFSLQILGSNHWGRFEMDSYQSELVSLTHDLEAEGISVRRPGHIERAALPAELQKAHIHVMPSRWDEPCALTLFEGMAAGLPVIASRTGGTPEVVGDAGMLFERDSVEGLAQSLEELVSSHALRVDYSRRARARAEHFTWDKTWRGFAVAAGIG